MFAEQSTSEKNGEFKRQPRDFAHEFGVLLQPSEEFIETYRPKLESITQSMMASVVNPELRRAIQLYGQHYDVALFGYGETPLPEGLIFVENKAGKHHIEFDPTIPYMNGRVFSVVQNEFNRRGINTAINSKEIEESRIEGRADLLEEAWRESAVYGFFKAFEASTSKHEEAPLNEYWRSIRERQIEDDVRVRHGVQNHETLHRGTQAYRDLQKGLYRLDDETMDKQQPEQTLSGLDKARKYLMTLFENVIKRECSDTNTDTPCVEFHTIDRGWGNVIDISFLTQSGTKVFEDFNTYIDAVTLQIDSLDVVDTRMKPYIQEILCEVIRAILDKDTESLTDALDATSNWLNTLPGIEKEVTENNIPYYDGLLVGTLANSLFYSFTNSSKMIDYETHYTLDEYNRKTYQLHGEFSHGSKKVSDQTMELERARTIGWKSGHIQGRRLLVPAAVEPRLPDFVGAPDLTIQIEEGSSVIPTIPGYTIIGKSAHGEYELKHNKDNDPYTPCEVTICDDKRLSLADAYEKAGLSGIALELRHMTEPSVADLTEILKSYSVYADGGWSGIARSIHSLDDLEGIGHEGRPVVQCTGAAQILRVSLEHIFGEGSANTMSGYVINPDTNRINGLQHMQTVFTYEGAYYHLDATPASTESTVGEMRLPAKTSIYKRLMAKLALQSKPVATPIIPADIPPVVEPIVPEVAPAAHNKQHDLAQIKAATIEYLKVHYDLRNEEALYKKIAKLPSHNPLRKVVQTVFQAANQTNTLTDIEEVIQYIALVSGASEKRRAIVDAHEYDQSLLNYLSATTQRLHAVVSQP